jgi:hypothetical protein
MTAFVEMTVFLARVAGRALRDSLPAAAKP